MCAPINNSKCRFQEKEFEEINVNQRSWLPVLARLTDVLNGRKKKQVR